LLGSHGHNSLPLYWKEQFGHLDFFVPHKKGHEGEYMMAELS